MSKAARRISIFAGLVILIGGAYAARFLSQQKEPPRRKTLATQLRKVDTMKAYFSTIPTSLEVQGELAAYDKIDIFAEVSGTLKSSSRPFKVGSYFPKGAVLINVDKQEAALNLLAQKSSLLNAITQLMPDLKIDYPESFAQWQEYLDRFELEQPIAAFPTPINKQEKYFIASRNLYNQYYSIKSAEERLSKYSIVAPFGGVITQASISPGAVVRAGQKLGELMNTNNYELVATLPLKDIRYINVGSSVKMYSEDINGEWAGKIKRINNQVESGTQTVKVFIEVTGKGLKEGMYLKGTVKANEIQDAIKIPRNLLVDQKAIYIVEADSILRYQEVEVLKITANDAIIRGISPGTKLVATPVPGAFNGMKVDVSSKETPAGKKDNTVGSLK
jgi:membrane fusion protein (multidrug efflux system)